MVILNTNQINPCQPTVVFHIETSNLFCSTKKWLFSIWNAISQNFHILFLHTATLALLTVFVSTVRQQEAEFRRFTWNVSKFKWNVWGILWIRFEQNSPNTSRYDSQALQCISLRLPHQFLSALTFGTISSSSLCLQLHTHKEAS